MYVQTFSVAYYEHCSTYLETSHQQESCDTYDSTHCPQVVEAVDTGSCVLVIIVDMLMADVSDEENCGGKKGVWFVRRGVAYIINVYC